MERYLLEADFVARITNNHNTRITAFAYPVSDNVYFLEGRAKRIRGIREAHIGHGHIKFSEPQGARHIPYPEKRPVFVWFKDSSGKKRTIKISS